MNSKFELPPNPLEGLSDEDVIEVPYKYVKRLTQTTRGQLMHVLQRIEQLKLREDYDDNSE